MGNPLYNDAELKRVSGNDGARNSEGTRTPFRKDYARLLHAASFRRLQGKTQLYPGVESDFFRNRLTHSLEVAQIGRGIAASLNQGTVSSEFPGAIIEEDLVEFACIAHDLGHPPFGHNGEAALDECMKDAGGFEGNAQTLRILACVERKLVQAGPNAFRNDVGLDLTLRSLAAVLKYDNQIPERRPKVEKTIKGYFSTEADLVAQIKRTVAPGYKGKKFKTIECAIMDIADDIAYSTYDLEDSLHAGFITPLSLVDALSLNKEIQRNVLRRTNSTLKDAGWPLVKSAAELLDVLMDVFQIKMPSPQFDIDRLNEKQRALMFNLEGWQENERLSRDALERTQFTAQRVGRLIGAIELRPNKFFPQLSGVRLKRPQLLQVEVLKHLNYEVVIRSSRLAVVEHRGKEIVQRLFATLVKSKGSLLPDDWKARYAEQKSAALRKRVVCDYIACMTDRYAVEMYERLFDEGATMFKPL